MIVVIVDFASTVINVQCC